jgi:hypothetical protein
MKCTRFNGSFSTKNVLKRLPSFTTAFVAQHCFNNLESIIAKRILKLLVFVELATHNVAVHVRIVIDEELLIYVYQSLNYYYYYKSR